MNNIFYEMIFKRKSFHIFRNVGNEAISKDKLNDIQSVYSEFTPLNPGIKTAIRIVPEKQTNCERGGEYCVLLYSEKKDGYLQNIGYLGEQLDLYLVSRNIGDYCMQARGSGYEFAICKSQNFRCTDINRYFKELFRQ